MQFFKNFVNFSWLSLALIKIFSTFVMSIRQSQKDTKTMTTQLRTAIQSFLYLEKRLNKETEKLQIALECEFDNVEVLSKRVDIFTEKLRTEVRMNALGFNMNEDDFLTAVCDFENGLLRA